MSSYALAFTGRGQDASVLAFAVTVSGPQFPAVLGVSVRNSEAGVIDLLANQIDAAGPVVCSIEHPEQLGVLDRNTWAHFRGEITFALWRDKTFQKELARLPWFAWRFADLVNPDPHRRVDPHTARKIEREFEAMCQRFAGAPRWNAKRV